MAKFSKKVVEEICEYIEHGLYQKDAAKLARISESTFYEWFNSKPEFSESVERAVANYKLKLLKLINHNAETNGRLALEILGRRWPDEFGVNPTNNQEGDYVTADKDEVRKFAEDLLELTD